MSSPLAIAAVTAALKDLLNDGLLNHDLSTVGSVTVTSLPPDRISTGQAEPNQLNVFLYQVTPNAGWRNIGLPSRDGNGARLSNAPLALDLHYLVTAYGSDDLNAEILLGYAMQLLHETPVLSRQQLRTVLGGVSPVDGSILPSPFGNLTAEDLADQIELIKISPVFLNTEDLSKLWTSMQARYRPSMAYMTSVVLIESTGATRSAPPVLKRGPNDRGPVALASPFPLLTSAGAAASDLLPAVRLGDQVQLKGTGFDSGASTVVVFEHATTGDVIELPPQSTTPTQMLVKIPAIADAADAMNAWHPGVYNVSLKITRPNTPVYTTNSVPIALAPLITIAPTSAAPGTLSLTVTSTPRLAAVQGAQTTLAFGSTAVAPSSVVNPPDTHQPTQVAFSVPGVIAGEYLVRLRVAGIESLPIVIGGTPPQLDFDPLQKVTVQ